MNDALLLIAHGSRRQQSNDEIRTLARKLARRSDNHFNVTDCAFLELAEPSIPEGIRRVAETGADRIVILPYFLSDGRHVHDDIPAAVDEARRLHPHVEIKLASYIGAAPSLADLLLHHATAAGDTTPS